MKRILGHILIGLTILLLSLSAILMCGAYYLRDKVKAIVVTEINKQATVPVTVQGSIDFSLIEHFPYASLSFHGVNIKNKLTGGPADFVDVQELSVLFNMWGLVHDQIEISRVLISDGEVNIYLDAQGNADYDIFKHSTDSKPGSTALNIDLRKSIVKNVKFSYLSQNKAEDIRLDIKKFDLSGNFHAERYDLTASGDLMIELLRLNGADYLSNKAFNADITIAVDQKENKFTFSKGNIEIAKNSFNLKGHFVSGKVNTYVNFTAETKGKDVSNLIALIPVKYKASLAGTEGKGGYEVEAKIHGNIRSHINPVIEVSATLANAEIQIPRVRKPLTHVEANVRYDMDSVGNDELAIKKFSSEFNGYPQHFSLRLVHLSEPDFALDADGEIDLHELRTFFGDSVLENAEGQVKFKAFHIEGSKRDLDNAQSARIKASGNFQMKNVEIQYAGITYGNINGGLQYKDQVITISQLSMNFLHTDFVFDGRVTNLIPYTISQSKRNNTSDNPLGVEGSLQMKSLDLNTIISAYTKQSKIAAKSPSAPTPVDVADVMNINGHVSVAIDKFVYGHMVFDKMQADLGLSPQRMNINSFTTQSMGGSLSNTGSITFTPDRQMVMNFRISADKINLPLLFRECDNFGQATLTDKNLKGSLSADAKLKMVYNNYRDIDLDKLEGKLACSVLRGELNDFAPIRSASAFIRMEELNHIVFSDLTNELDIKNRIVTIPRMEIQSTAVNLIMAGTHTLDNQIDYQIKINLRKLLAAKFGRKENEQSYIEEDPYEGLNVYLRITGDASKPKIKFDRQSVKNKLKDDIAAQKEELKEIFGKGGKKEKGADELKREEKYYDTRKKPEFINFDEDSAK